MHDNISEGQYLIKLLASAINNSPIDYPSGNFSWNDLFTLASFHSVANTAFYGLQKLPDASIIPEDIYEQFASAANKYSAMESLQQFETRQIFQRFEQNKIICIPLDGYIIKGYYPRPDMRYISTLDLLINQSDKNKIHIVLNSLGYTLVNNTNDRINYLKNGNINLSLRTSLLPEKPEFSQYFSDIVNNTENKNGLKYINQLNAENFYVYTMAQLAHLYSSGGAGIRSVLDIWVLLKRLSPTFDREYIDKQLNKLNLQLFAYYMEEFSKIWFDTQYKNKNDNEIYEQMRSHLLEDYKCQTYKSFNQETNMSYINNKSSETIDKTTVFPPLDHMKEVYPILTKMPFLLPIFWLVRLVTLGFNKEP